MSSAKSFRVPSPDCGTVAKRESMRYSCHVDGTVTGAVVRESKIADVREANLSEEIEATSHSVLKPRNDVR